MNKPNRHIFRLLRLELLGELPLWQAIVMVLLFVAGAWLLM